MVFILSLTKCEASGVRLHAFAADFLAALGIGGGIWILLATQISAREEQRDTNKTYRRPDQPGDQLRRALFPWTAYECDESKIEPGANQEAHASVADAGTM